VSVWPVSGVVFVSVFGSVFGRTQWGLCVLRTPKKRLSVQLSVSCPLSGCGSEPQPSQSPASAQPEPNQNSTKAQPELNQSSAKAQPKLSQSSARAQLELWCDHFFFLITFGSDRNREKRSLLLFTITI